MTSTLAQYKEQFALKQEAARSLAEAKRSRGYVCGVRDIESDIASLVADWDDWKDYLGGDSDMAVKAIAGRIASLIQKLGIARYGKVREVTDYHPIRHSLVEGTPEPTSKVSIIKSGILVERVDGTQQVLLPAIAKIVV